MNIYEFNKVIYKGNVNRDFYFYCLKKNMKLIKYLFINLFNIILSFVFKNKGDVYVKNKFKYLKDVKNLKKEIKMFYDKGNCYNLFFNNKVDLIIDKVPTILIPKDLSDEVIGYRLDDDFCVDMIEYNERIAPINSGNELYVRNRYHFFNICCKKVFVVNNNFIHVIEKRNKVNKKVLTCLTIILLSLLLTIISFCYTSSILDIKMICSYFDWKLFLLNFLPILLLIVFAYLLTKRMHVSFLFNSVVLLLFGIINQTKVLYRDDVINFSDVLLFKEALTMTERYDIVIKKYTVIFLIIIIIIFFLLKKFGLKLKISIKKYFVSLMVIINIMIISYLLLYNNEEIYGDVGNTDLINVWINTRQSQIRGLVYPFIYSIKDAFDSPPDGYNEQKSKSILDEYNYTNIPSNKKVNIISIMLEAYNDFSKFEKIDFDEDVYADLHEIESKSISGNLVTNIFGGGTIMTERQFLTGYYNFPNFRTKTNSYVWYFKEQGYRTEAMHPIYGAFYNRASYNPNLGFDVYYNYENKFSKIQEDFLTDYYFFDYIIEGYNNAKKDNIPYFNFSVTYQNHGPYYSSNYDGKQYYFENIGYDIEEYNIINEYFSGIKKTNAALKKLISYFEKEDEPVIVIFFGDHNPYLGENGYIELGINLDLSSVDGFENYYETPYVIYANDAAKIVFDKDFIGKGSVINPIFLMNELFDYCGLTGNEYLQYMDYVKNNVDVISNYYYKEDGQFVKKENSKYSNLINEYNGVNYYYSRNFLKK